MSASPSELPPQAYVYAIGAIDGPQKIGIAKNPKSRITGIQIGSHIEFSINVSVPVNRDDVRTVERCCHALLRAKRIRGEWFNVNPEQAGEVIEQAISMVQAGWTAEGEVLGQHIVMTPANLKLWRQQRGWSQDEAAENLGCGRRSLQLWESGTNEIPHYIALACTALDLGLDEWSDDQQSQK